MKKLLIAAAFSTIIVLTTHAQVSLTGTNYFQDFNSLGSGLPTGWTTRLGVSTTSLGTALAFTNTGSSSAINNWGDSAGAFKNYASATGLVSNSTTAAQQASTNRSLGITPTGSFGDVATNYAAFVLQLNNTTGFENFALSMDAMVLSSQTRTNVWTLDYGVGASPTSFTTLTNWTTPASFGTTTLSISSASLSSIANLSDNVWIRFSLLTPSTGSGSRDRIGIDNFSLTYTAAAGTEYFWTADGSVLGGAGTWNSSNTNWSAAASPVSGVAWDSSKRAVFTNNAATLTVDAILANKGLQFSTTGYLLSGGTLTLGGVDATANSILADSGVSAEISSTLAGTTGMTKSGGGTLVLSGSNTFSGNATISAGTLQIASDAALGNTANDLVNNATLKTTTTIALDAARDISGSGIYDIANGTTLTVNGNINNTATTLANTGLLDLQGATRSIGSITLNAAGTINGAGAISNVTGLTAPGVTSGTATINPDIIFTSGDKTLNVAAGGTVDLNGALSGNTNRILKTGSGTLILSAANNLGGLRVGASAATPTDGGTVILENSQIGTLAQAIQHNYGTLSAASNLVFTNGISIGGRSGAVAVLAGSNMEFQGTNSFFRAGGTSGEMRLDVNNTTTFSSGFGATGGGGTSTGTTFGGTGTLVIGGDSPLFTDLVTFGSSLTAVQLTSSNALAGATIVSGSDKLQFATSAINVAGVTGSQNLSLQTIDPTPLAVALTMNASGLITNSGVISGSGSFNKAGSGTVVLAGNNTYAGTTTVTAGSLIVNGNQSAATGGISVASGAKLGGAGTLGGAVSVLGTLAPGSSIESLSMGALSFSNASTFAVELDSSAPTSAGADLVVVSGGLSLDGTVTLSLADIAVSPTAFTLGTTFSLINYTGSWNNGLFTLSGGGLLNEGAQFAFGLNTWEIRYADTIGGANFTADQLSGNFVNIEAVPEPSTYALLALSALGLAGHVIRRRRR